MRSVPIAILVLHGLANIELGAVSVGIVRNASLLILNANTTIIHGPCEACVCSLLTQPTFFSLNCRSDSLTCELYSVSDQNRAFTLMTGVNVSFYFLSLPTYTAPQSGTVEYLWPFDSTVDDTSSTFIGTPVNDASFSQLTIAGYGSSLSLNASMGQSVAIDQPYLKLYDQSWTFEAWIRLASIASGWDCSILQQRDSPTPDKALHLIIRNDKLYLGFFEDDLPGVTDLTASRWHHTAFTFDSITRNQSIYLDGVLDASRQANRSYLGTSGTLSIGYSDWFGNIDYFDGLIDQLSFTNRTKTSDEILRDATLTLDVSFDSNSLHDQGPLSINGSVAGNTSFVSGRRNQALHIDNVNDSYFTVHDLVLLGRDDQSYSLSIWIKPAAQQKASIIYMSSASDGTGWCLPMIGLTDTSQLVTTSWNGGVMKVTGPVVPINSWTHVVATYSLTNGLGLYINGSLHNLSSPFSYQASGTPNYLFIGSCRANMDCRSLSSISGQYSGVVDELRVYSRELTLNDAIDLASA